jgi:hypothetical protein
MSTRKVSSVRATSPQTNGGALRRAVNWIVNDSIFHNLKLHGNVTWKASGLVCLALFWVWSPESSLVQAAKAAIEAVTAIFGSAAVGSYQALTGALKTYTGQLLPVLWLRLQSLMADCDDGSWRIGLWLALAVDGSRVGTPRTWKNELRFCKPAVKRGKKKGKKAKKRSRRANQKRRAAARRKSHHNPHPESPQMWLTLIWHIGIRLPWCWKIGPSYSSERDHLLEMLAEQRFPEFTLFCADAGFVGYDFWQGIAERDHHFLIRVGSNVRLLKQLGYVRERNGIVYSWPNAAMKKEQLPLVMRLLHFHDGHGDVYLVTNVLSEKELTDGQASTIYRQRWGVELQFRSFKQTFGRSKLRSRTPDCAEIELHWSLLGLWMLQLLAFKEQTGAGEPADHTSIAAVLRIIRWMMHNESRIPSRGESLPRRLASAQIDDYERHTTKTSRNYPRRKEKHTVGRPTIQTATQTHKQKLRELQSLAQAT